MRILITGSNSFIGKNLYETLMRSNEHELAILDSLEDFNSDYNNFDIIYHLYTEYRSDNQDSFMRINVGLTKSVMDYYCSPSTKFVLLSSVQAGNGSYYGDSKLLAEKEVKKYAEKNGNTYAILRLANEFGKWCKPNYNSVVATFCYKIARKEPIMIEDPEKLLHLEYIDDIIAKLIELGHNDESGIVTGEKIHDLTVGDLADVINSFQYDRERGNVPEIQDVLQKELYSTYLTYLPKNQFGVELNMHMDDRGMFTEMLHFDGKGQVSINVSKPGITKGNHWHDTKTEKFIVVSGEALISFRKVGTDEVITYKVSGDNIQSIDIPPGYTHSITNIGQTDLITVMWANEIFNPEKPDTYYMEVMNNE